MKEEKQTKFNIISDCFFSTIFFDRPIPSFFCIKDFISFVICWLFSNQSIFKHFSNLYFELTSPISVQLGLIRLLLLRSVIGPRYSDRCLITHFIIYRRPGVIDAELQIYALVLRNCPIHHPKWCVP